MMIDSSMTAVDGQEFADCEAYASADSELAFEGYLEELLANGSPGNLLLHDPMTALAVDGLERADFEMCASAFAGNPEELLANYLAPTCWSEPRSALPGEIPQYLK